MAETTWKNLGLYLSFMIVIITTSSSEVTSSFDKCKKDFFYLEIPPKYTGNQNSNVKQICQMYKDKYYYATSFDTKRRIPHYSAYSLKSFENGGGNGDDWYNEPQLENIKDDANMVLDENKDPSYLTNQATHIEYVDSGYSRGHLSPASYHAHEGKKASRSMTNIAPQIVDFNNKIWSTLEEALYKIVKANCSFVNGRIYFITGVLPRKNTDRNTIHEGDNKRVNVPTHYWTAVCCDSSRSDNLQNGWSAGFIGENKPADETNLWYEPIKDLKNTIKYQTIFADHKARKEKISDCNYNAIKTEQIAKKVFDFKEQQLTKIRMKRENERKKANKKKKRYRQNCQVPTKKESPFYN